MQFGIDAINFYTSKYYLDLQTLATARDVVSTKFSDELGQHKMAVAPPCEDPITMAANGVNELLATRDTSGIELVIFATESGVDAAKSAATHIHGLFNLPKRCRSVEIKQACYGATFGLQMVLAWLQQNEKKQALLIASDIASYGLDTAAEASQGCGAIAMLLSANPKLLTIDSHAGFCTKETMDFWRPNYLDYALVDGRLSCDVYMRLAKESLGQYLALSERQFSDHDRFCYHTPIARLVESTHRKLARGSLLSKELCERQIRDGLVYGREVGNCYTASLYLGVLSLLENSDNDLSDRLIGLYSYGSGSVAEFFAARVVRGYRDHLPKQHTGKILELRKELSLDDYERWHRFQLPTSGENFEFSEKWDTGKFRLKGIREHQRIYERLE
jgi:hydroxymethylglutaryl-CoA synthase